jgi:hypothetical protein
MVLPIDVLDFVTVRGTDPRMVDVRLLTTMEGGLFLMKHWMKSPSRFAEIAEVVDVPGLFRSRCIGCGHFDNEVLSARCHIYDEGHYMVLVDTTGTAKLPLSHVPTTAKGTRR